MTNQIKIHTLKDGDEVEILPNYYFYESDENSFIFDKSFDTCIKLDGLYMHDLNSSNLIRNHFYVLPDDLYSNLFLELKSYNVISRPKYMINRGFYISFAKLNGELCFIRYGYGLYKKISLIDFHSKQIYCILKVLTHPIAYNLVSYDDSYIDTSKYVKIDRDNLFQQYKESGLIDFFDNYVEKFKISNNILKVYNTLKYYNDGLLNKESIKREFISVIRSEKLKNIFENE